MSDTELLAKPEPVRRLEVFTGAGRRRNWPAEQKARIVAESYESGETVCAVARLRSIAPPHTPKTEPARQSRGRTAALLVRH